MSSPITINYPASASRAYERSELSSSPSSPGLYVPVHRRARVSGSGMPGSTPSSYASASSGSRSVSPAPSRMCAMSPITSMGHSSLLVPIYTPADLIRLSTSPLVGLSPETRDVLRAVAPEVVQSRKQRKAQEWRARLPQAGSHQRTPSHASSSHSEEEEERAMTWRKV